MRKFFLCIFMLSGNYLLAQAIKLPYVPVAHQFQRDPNKHITAFPYLSPDTFRAYCDHVVDASQEFFDPSLVKNGDTIYIYPYLFQFFFTQIHPKIQARYIIISSNEDHHIPGPYISYLNSSKIIAWIGKNAHAKLHSKIIGIPIGFANTYWLHGNVALVKQVAPEMPTHRAQLYQRVQKKHLLYMNFSLWTYPMVRKYVYKLFIDTPFCYYAQKRNYKDYLLDMAESCFVLSPRGNGVDCHRTWEALAVGAIPIVKSSILNPLFKGLPVLIVSDWNVINEAYLKDVYENMKHRQYEYERMYAPYWFKKIDRVKHRVLDCL